MPFLLPDTPVVAWWPDIAPEVPAQDPLGQLAIRRITDATNGDRPAGLHQEQAGRLHHRRHRPGWSRITYWRALLTSALDQAPHEPITSALVSGLKNEPALDILAGWLASRIDGPVTRAVGELKVELNRDQRDHHAVAAPRGRDRDADAAPASPDALLPLARRETRDCLAEDMRRLDADEIYHEALQGMDKVKYA